MQFYTLLFFLCSFFVFAYSKPPREIPQDLLGQFTMNGKVSVLEWYTDETRLDVSFYSKETIDGYIERIKRKETFYDDQTDIWLYEALEKYPIAGKDVAIIGSSIPWYESVVIAYGGRPTTIEYSPLITDDDRLTILTSNELDEILKKFDVVLSISSIEREGLGKYGEPVNPTADLELMSMIRKNLLKEDGYMILAVPIGRDCLYWNANRIYGRFRLPLLLQGWDLLDSFGFNNVKLFGTLGDDDYLPVFCLKLHKNRQKLSVNNL